MKTMVDRNGVKIYKDVILLSLLFGSSGPKMRCFGYRKSDGKIVLGQDKIGEKRIYLTQDELLTTHFWMVNVNITAKDIVNDNAAEPIYTEKELIDQDQLNWDNKNANENRT